VSISSVNLARVAIRIVPIYSVWLAELFQILLIVAVCNSMLRHIAQFALIVAVVLIAAQILCTFPGSYLYKFPGEIQI